MNSNQIHGFRVKFRAEFKNVIKKMSEKTLPSFDAIIRFSSKDYSNPEILRIFYIIDLRFLGEHHTGVLLINFGVKVPRHGSRGPSQFVDPQLLQVSREPSVDNYL